ncbi:MAG: Rne/Rng family ribonuclease [Candidatus Glassbacteria bacterium]|nr:Rne/Rng family ribonuclease [Candidatus Glassbacteria bacterium]
MANQQRYKSPKRDIIISVELNQTRVAILEDSHLVELLVDQDSESRMVGDIYKGIVRKVLPGMQAAFVDIGLPKQGFLHISDIGNELFTKDVEQDAQAEEAEKKKRRRKIQTIQDQLKEGQEIMVQVTKEPIGTKGPRVSSEISIPGRLLVYAPFDNRLGISRKIEAPAARARIRDIMKKIVTSREGLIVRTAAEDTKAEDFKAECQSLRNLWRRVKRQAAQASAPSMIYRETKLISSLLRDVFTDKVDSLVVDDGKEFKRIKDYLRIIAPSLTGRLVLYKKPDPVFTSYGLDDEIRRIFHRKVWLKSGGYIVIEQTEALVSIDVNTGRYTGERSQEDTILRTNLDAAREIARQIRLRDLGGIIVCDFIDMESKNNRQAVLDELRRYLKYDRAKTKAFELSPLGLVEMSRQRVRSSLHHSLTQPCPTCEGRGRIFTPEAIVSEIERAVKKIAPAGKVNKLMIRVHPVVALHLMEQGGNMIQELESQTGLTIQLRDDPLMRMDSINLLSLPTRKEIEISW